jgi:Fe-S cluster assembly protein SufD
MTALPTKRDESWRYSDLDAVARVWPVATKRHVVAAGETLVLPILIDGDGEAVTIEDHEIEIGAGARAVVQAAVTGGKLGRLFVRAKVAEGGHFELTGAILAGGEETHEIVTRVNHAKPDGTSRQTVRIILADQAVGSYLGKVAVARGAQKIDAGQSAKAMLLNRAATANLKPELEIFADDVKCAHGATVGELDPQALFYLASRGIAPAEAKALLLRAFVGGLFDGNEAFVAAIDKALERLL